MPVRIMEMDIAMMVEQDQICDPFGIGEWIQVSLVRSTVDDSQYGVTGADALIVG
jgi:hypothetical protein